MTRYVVITASVLSGYVFAIAIFAALSVWIVQGVKVAAPVVRKALKPSPRRRSNRFAILAQQRRKRVVLTAPKRA